MNKETLRMQMLAGLITESQYKQKLNEEDTSSKQLNADYDNDGGTDEDKFARVLADNVMAGFYPSTIEGLYDEDEMQPFIDGDDDDFYSSLSVSKKVFASLPSKFILTANPDGDELYKFEITKTGKYSFDAEELN